MSRVVKPKNSQSNISASLGFEARLWLAADKLRNNMARENTSTSFLA